MYIIMIVIYSIIKYQIKNYDIYYLPYNEYEIALTHIIRYVDGFFLLTHIHIQ
jgi:hypothetical protein